MEEMGFCLNIDIIGAVDRARDRGLNVQSVIPMLTKEGNGYRLRFSIQYIPRFMDDGSDDRDLAVLMDDLKKLG